MQVISLMTMAVVLAGCFQYDCVIDPEGVEVQFHPKVGKENATAIMDNLSQEYNFTISYWDLRDIRYDPEDAWVESWTLMINVTDGREQWVSYELENNASIYKVRILFTDC